VLVFPWAGSAGIDRLGDDEFILRRLHAVDSIVIGPS
jgi:hypothetical protein